MAKKYGVHLTGEEQEELRGWYPRAGRRHIVRLTPAFCCSAMRIRTVGPCGDADIARALRVGTATVERVRRRCVEEGLERALGRKEQLNRRPRKLDGEGEARLTALACSQPPNGRSCWTLHLLAEQLVEREIVDSISTETVRRCLKKTGSSLG